MEETEIEMIRKSNPNDINRIAEIWIDIYAITKLLDKNKSAVYRPEGEKEFYRKYQMYEPNIEVFAD